MIYYIKEKIGGESTALTPIMFTDLETMDSIKKFRCIQMMSAATALRKKRQMKPRGFLEATSLVPAINNFRYEEVAPVNCVAEYAPSTKKCVLNVKG